MSSHKKTAAPFGAVVLNDTQASSYRRGLISLSGATAQTTMLRRWRLSISLKELFSMKAIQDNNSVLSGFFLLFMQNLHAL
jgi:hypothetical protein